MNWNDYEAVWKRQKLPVGPAADLTELKGSFESRRRKQAAALLVRDWIEVLACGIMVVAYTVFWQQVGPTGWPMAGAILLILVVAGVFIRERLRTRRNRLGATASVLAKVEADLAELQHQRHLLLRVWAWYIAPCAGAMVIHAFVIVRRTRDWDPLRAPLSLAGIGLFVALLCGLVWLINRRAVRKQIEPRITELEKLHRDLTGTNG